MINFADLNKAEDNINHLKKLRDDLIKSTQYFNDIGARITWCKTVYNTIPEKQQEFLDAIEDPIVQAISFSASTFDFQQASGATGSFYAASIEAKKIIKSYGHVHYDLINQYNALNSAEELIERIINDLNTLRPNLAEFKPQAVLLAAKEAYVKWKAGIITNSILAGEIRAFQDIFNGMLHRARLDTYPEIKSKDESWPKMAEALAKNGGGCLKQLKSIQGKEDSIHLDFTNIFKQTKSVTKEEMDELFKDYIQQVYSILKLIDEELIK